ncbi:hypothetical protein C8J46_105487 [Sphingomonas sp. PP-F2F-A104-K0414]|nr:hypothetical protein C8J46_105487 [Sphingomonas sp. PP-F2F-A104-K0414]
MGLCGPGPFDDRESPAHRRLEHIGLAQAKAAALMHDRRAEQAVRDVPGALDHVTPCRLGSDFAERLLEQHAPMGELGTPEIGNDDVLEHRISSEFARAEQYGTPEVVHLYEMRRPVGHMRGKDRSEDVV